MISVKDIRLLGDRWIPCVSLIRKGVVILYSKVVYICRFQLFPRYFKS